MDPKLAARFRVKPFRSSLDERLRTRAVPLVRLFHYWRRELRAANSISWRDRWRSWRLGFHTDSYLLYELDRHDPRDYIPDGMDLRYVINDPNRASLHNKLTLSRLMERYAVPHARALGVLHGGRMSSFERPNSGRTDLKRGIDELLSTHEAAVFKPAQGGMGHGILLVRRDGDALSVNGVCATLDEFAGFVTTLKHYYISEFVEQASYAREIFPDSPNTLRVLTVWDLEREEPFVAAAAHRFGSSRSRPVDNFHQGNGGISTEVDLESGRLGSSVGLVDGRYKKGMSRHPETGVPIQGVVVPYWENARRGLVSFAANFPQVPIVGWDLIIANDGMRCLEANCPPGLAVWQAHGPLLTDPRVRSCFETLGKLNKRA